MKVIAKIAAGLGAVVFTATAVGLPDVCGYCTARAMSAAGSHHVVAAGSQPGVGHAAQVFLRGLNNQHWRLPI